MNYARACNTPLDTTLPEWIELLPAGPTITGADGRAWNLPNPQTVVAAFQQRHTPLVIDWEHASEHRAPHGLDAPAAGWITQLEVRNAQIWGQVEWTSRAQQQIQAREYRYLSPVFIYEKPTRRILELTSAGLTNQPNLNLTALNQEQQLMDLTPILAALDLPPDTDMEGIVSAILTLKQPPAEAAANRMATPSLDKFVPRPDFDAAIARAANAEQRLATLENAQRDTVIEVLIQRAINNRQISPATQGYYRSMCQTEGGIAEFEKFLNSAPPIIGALNTTERPPPPRKSTLDRASFNALDANARHAFIRQGGTVLTN